MLACAGLGVIRAISRLLRGVLHKLAVGAKLTGAGAVLVALVVVLDAVFVPSGARRERGSRLPRP